LDTFNTYFVVGCRLFDTEKLVLGFAISSMEWCYSNLKYYILMIFLYPSLCQPFIRN